MENTLFGAGLFLSVLCERLSHVVSRVSCAVLGTHPRHLPTVWLMGAGHFHFWAVVNEAA